VGGVRGTRAAELDPGDHALKASSLLRSAETVKLPGRADVDQGG
jgi:hypothetical protein